MKTKSILYCVAILLLPFLGYGQSDSNKVKLSNYAELGCAFHFVSNGDFVEEYRFTALGPSLGLGLNWYNFDLRMTLTPLIPTSFDTENFAPHHFTNGFIFSPSFSAGYAFNVDKSFSFIPRMGVRDYSGDAYFINTGTDIIEKLEINSKTMFELSLSIATRPAERIAVNFEFGFRRIPYLSSFYYIQFGVRVGRLTKM